MSEGFAIQENRYMRSCLEWWGLILHCGAGGAAGTEGSNIKGGGWGVRIQMGVARPRG